MVAEESFCLIITTGSRERGGPGGSAGRVVRVERRIWMRVKHEDPKDGVAPDQSKESPPASGSGGGSAGSPPGQPRSPQTTPASPGPVAGGGSHSESNGAGTSGRRGRPPKLGASNPSGSGDQRPVSGSGRSERTGSGGTKAPPKKKRIRVGNALYSYERDE